MAIGAFVIIYLLLVFIIIIIINYAVNNVFDKNNTKNHGARITTAQCRLQNICQQCFQLEFIKWSKSVHNNTICHT